jgi:hypothetical protein
MIPVASTSSMAESFFSASAIAFAATRTRPWTEATRP